MNTNTQGTAHLFFLYLHPHHVPHTLGISNQFEVHDTALSQRIHHVLRLRSGESVQFFTGAHVITVLLSSGAQNKDRISGTITGFLDIEKRPRNLIAAISLLKRDAFEAAVYSAAQMGAHIITPILTTKSRQKYMNDKEPARLEKIIIAACEQAKNPHIPKLAAPVTVEQVLNRYKKHNIVCFDVDGSPLSELMTALPTNTNDVCVLIGPEGGLTPDELATVNNAGVMTVRLTSTILRSRDAACLGLGVVNSVIF